MIRIWRYLNLFYTKKKKEKTKIHSSLSELPHRCGTKVRSRKRMHSHRQWLGRERSVDRRTMLDRSRSRLDSGATSSAVAWQGEIKGDRGAWSASNRLSPAEKVWIGRRRWLSKVPTERKRRRERACLTKRRGLGKIEEENERMKIFYPDPMKIDWSIRGHSDF